jgi:hypothetical protein
MSKQQVSIGDFCSRTGQLVKLDPSRFMPLPPPYDNIDFHPKFLEQLGITIEEQR